MRALRLYPTAVYREAAQWKCPACGAGLHRGTAQQGVLPCPDCGGIWTDTAAASAIEQLGDKLTEISRAAVAGTFVSPPPDIPNRTCPVCSKPLTQGMIGKLVCIDVCAEDGTWFDRGEAEWVVAAVRDPDLAAQGRTRRSLSSSSRAPFADDMKGVTLGASFAEVLAKLAK